MTGHASVPANETIHGATGTVARLVDRLLPGLSDGYAIAVCKLAYTPEHQSSKGPYYPSAFHIAIAKEAFRHAAAAGPPREPTQAMIAEGYRILGEADNEAPVGNAWRAMYDAAPPAASAAPANQCDGCMRDLPLDGDYHTEKGALLIKNLRAWLDDPEQAPYAYTIMHSEVRYLLSLIAAAPGTKWEREALRTAPPTPDDGRSDAELLRKLDDWWDCNEQKFAKDTTHAAARLRELLAERDADARQIAQLNAEIQGACDQWIAITDALAWVMLTHVKDGTIIDPRYTDTINDALIANAGRIAPAKTGGGE